MMFLNIKKMNFKYKCFLQILFYNLYKGEMLNYFFQRYVTKNLPISDLFFKQRVLYSYDLFLKFQKYNSLSENTKRYYEFGAGWDLLTPLSMSALGFNVSCIDIRRLVFSNLIINSLDRLDSFSEGNIRENFQKFDYNSGDVLVFLEKNKNFYYCAPKDARDTGFEKDYFDFASSTEVFEHVPEKDLYNILVETYNILKPGGIFILKIDYRDHWAFFDKKISIYNYLKYSEQEWDKYNPSLHYQNRLRHIDHIEIIKKTSFEIVSIDLNLPNNEELIQLKSLKVSEKFKKYSINDLSIKSSIIILRKPNL